MAGATSAARQAFLSVGRKNTKGGVFEATVEKGANHLLVLLALVRFKPDTHEVAGGFDEFFLREQTVLRGGVARSEDS